MEYWSIIDFIIYDILWGEILKSKINYCCYYDESNDVYKVWKEDGSSLEGFIPDGLFQQVAYAAAMRGDIIFVNGVQKAKHFSENGKAGFIDLNNRTFSNQEIEIILGDTKENISKDIPKSKNPFQKVLSRFSKSKKN